MSHLTPPRVHSRWGYEWMPYEWMSQDKKMRRLHNTFIIPTCCIDKPCLCQQPQVNIFVMSQYCPLHCNYEHAALAIMYVLLMYCLWCSYVGTLQISCYLNENEDFQLLPIEFGNMESFEHILTCVFQCHPAYILLVYYFTWQWKGYHGFSLHCHLIDFLLLTWYGRTTINPG